ncbi:MAG: sulfatase-like hydrolase/transferase [Nitrospirae bacterium]|nr:sulfatase-like hydrolase/transferase [Nitrospirota bacterium]
MSTYGYLYGDYRETTPYISEWAKNASKFTMTEASSNYTIPTTSSLMTSKRVWTHGLYNANGYSINADTENLPLLLKNSGYYNIALIQNPLLSVETLGISKSFDIAIPVEEFMKPRSVISVTTRWLFQLFGNKYRTYNGLIQSAFLGQIFYSSIPIKVTSTEYPPEKVFNRFLEIIENNPPEPFFAWLHVFPPHDPYLPPDPFMGMFDSSQKLRTEKSQWLSDDFDTARARYDEYIKYCDKTFENFIKEFSGHIKNTVIILSADHGHSFAHSYRGHGGPHLYEQLTNIPLIIMEPDQTQGRIIDDVVEQIDIAPTILELAGIPLPSWMEGRSLIPLVKGKELTLKPALSMYLEKNPKLQEITEGTFAVWDGDYKLIHYLKENKSLLFNLKQDRGELDNLFTTESRSGSTASKSNSG